MKMATFRPSLPTLGSTEPPTSTMPTVFVTTGATVPFKELITLTLDPKFLDTLSLQGYDKLIIQHGKSTEGTEHFLALKKNLKTKIDVEGIAFSDDVGSLISAADLVISHAGTGSILDTLRLQKNLIVVINDKLMGNHQAEVADELSKYGFLLKTPSSLESLVAAIKEAQNFSYKTLPTQQKNVIQQMLVDI